MHFSFSLYAAFSHGSYSKYTVDDEGWGREKHASPKLAMNPSLGAEVLHLSSHYFPMEKLKPLFPGREAMRGILRGNNYSGLDIHFPDNTPFTKILRECVRGAQCVLNHHDALSGHATRPAVQPQPKAPPHAPA